MNIPPDMELTGTLTAIEWHGLRLLLGRHVAYDDAKAVAMKIDAILAPTPHANEGTPA